MVDLERLEAPTPAVVGAADQPLVTGLGEVTIPGGHAHYRVRSSRL